MDAWIVWLVLGVICVIVEIFTTGFFFMSIGIGAIIAGVFARFIPNKPLQILIFAVVTFLIFVFTRKWSKKIIKESLEATNVEALKGKNGLVIKDIPEDGRGYVKVGGEEWSAISRDGKAILKDEKVTVERVEGNKLIVFHQHVDKAE